MPKPVIRARKATLPVATTIQGNPGDDTYFVTDPSTVILEAPGQGTDTIYSTVNYSLAPGSEIEVLAADPSIGTSSIQLAGNEFNNQLNGGAGPDILSGLGGSDTLIGGTGADQMSGGTGNDTYFVDNAGDTVVDSVGEGYDVVAAGVTYALIAGSEIELLTTGFIAGTAAINFTGNELANQIWGNDGANILNGGGGNDELFGFGGNDTLIGGTGNDTMFIDSAGDAIVEAAGEGYDVVAAGLSYTLGAGVEIELITTGFIGGMVTIDFTGNEFANQIWGNGVGNSLNGGGGNDALFGFGGNDILVGGTGADLLAGGTGNDTMFVDDAGDIILEAAGEGFDVVAAGVTYALGTGAEIELLTTGFIAGTAAINFTGNELANQIWGNDGVNVLNGGGGNDELFGFGGNDTLIGGTGNDTMFVDSAGDTIVEAAGEGYDTLAAGLSYTLGAGAEIDLITTGFIGGTAAIDFTGNDFANQIWGNASGNTLNGGGGIDALFGFDGNDTLIGGAGNDALFGGEGADTLNSSNGDDTLIGGNGADIFAFTTAIGAGNVDTITDFTVGVDKILLGGGLGGEPFTLLASGALAPGAFFIIGSGTQQAEDVILYNSATGDLFYDFNGNGAGGVVQFAVLGTGLNLTAGDFTVSGPANNVPVVSSGATAILAENSPVSTIVYQGAASDADGDRITWSLGGADASAFTIDANGAVRLIAAANFEVKSAYSFSVIASDSGPTPGVQSVALTITDVNENNPSTPTFNETSAPNDNIGAAQAIDRNLFVVAPNPNLPNASLPSGTILGRVDSFADGDYYSITLQAGEKIVLDVDGTSEGLDSEIFLYNSSGSLLISNDDKGTPDPGSGIQFGHNTDSYLEFRVATSGTYYFKIASFSGQGQQSLGNYQLNVSIGPVATAAQIAQETADKNIDALISGDMWDHKNLTYGFPQLASQYPTQFDELSNGFAGFNSDQIGATQQLLQLVANVSQLTFAPNSFQPGQADLRYARSDEADVAYAYYPTNGGPTSIGGTAWFGDNPVWDHPIRGNYSWMGILHETGHALGLKHGHEDPAITSDRDSLEYSVMTYRSYIGGDLEGYSNETFGYPQTLMQYDIGALQRTYGANFNFNAGDSVYTWDSGTGTMSINGASQGAPGTGTASSNRVFMTIWDGGGNDTYNLSNYTNGTTIDLRPGEWSKTSPLQTANLGDGHFARGNIANALLYNGNTASLIENAITGPGDDVLVANQAANHLTGGSGADIFRWMTIDDAGLGALADTITDFLRGADKIDFSQLDAIPTTFPRDAFSFIGTAAFHNVVGEVRYDVISGHAHIFADADGNGVADMEIIVNDNTILTGSDFNF